MRSSVSILFATEPQAALAKKIASLTPGGPLTESLFTMGGTEANETAIQPARCFTGNTEIVALRHFIMASPPPAMTLTEARGGLGLPQAGIVHAA
jgi:acetylornithine/succinyldiaminopimelate/putrescine aminotransferase